MALLNDLLAFSRLPPPRLRSTPLNELVRSAIMALSIPERVTVTWELAPELPPLLADARQIEQAVSNLGLNALQAMPDGGCLTVSTRCEGDRVEIVVDDTGPGVPPELHEKVLEPFFSTKVTGTGLGLPLSARSWPLTGGSSPSTASLARARGSRWLCLSRHAALERTAFRTLWRPDLWPCRGARRCAAATLLKGALFGSRRGEWPAAPPVTNITPSL